MAFVAVGKRENRPYWSVICFFEIVSLVLTHGCTEKRPVYVHADAKETASPLVGQQEQLAERMRRREV